MIRKSLFRATMWLSGFLRRLSESLGQAAVRRWARDEEARAGHHTGDETRDAGETREINAMRSEMLSGILEIGETVAREVMVPRTAMVCFEASATLEEVLAATIEAEHSRIPVYDTTVDNIVGVLYTKDLLKLWTRQDAPFNLKGIIRPPYFIPETKPLAVLLREFQRNRVHMAIVVDEYGGTAGLVTLEDVLEEITGEIQDEYDVAEEQVTKLDNGELLLDARLGVEAVEELLGITVEKEEFESLGGMVITVLGHLPRVGESFTFEGYRFIVDKATDRKVVKIRVAREEHGADKLSG